jgi:prophage regulatory protein
MRFLRIRQVMQVTGLSRMTIYRLEIAGQFPRRRQLSENSVAWLESDIENLGKSAARRAAPWSPEGFLSSHRHQVTEAADIEMLVESPPGGVTASL